jgi:short-subunit dehydrogenase
MPHLHRVSLAVMLRHMACLAQGLRVALHITKEHENMATMTQQRPLAAVTGASSGIGYELARQFAMAGYDLVICAEDTGIHAAAGTFESDGARVHPVQVDLRRYEGVERFYEEIRQQVTPLEAIAINAGVGVFGDFARETDLREELAMIQLNVVATVHLSKLAAMDMVGRGRGKILITASVAATMPTPLEAVYGATKAFDLSFAASLRHELKDSGVNVTALLPGPTNTDFFDRAGGADTKAAQEAEKNDPADVAKQAFEALMAGKDRVYGATSIGTKLQGMSARFVPESVKAGMHQKLAEHGSRDK